MQILIGVFSLQSDNDKIAYDEGQENTWKIELRPQDTFRSQASEQLKKKSFIHNTNKKYIPGLKNCSIFLVFRLDFNTYHPL